MTDLGKINRLTVIKKVDFGVYLDGGNDGNILLPRRYLPESCEIGDELNVFLYLDSEDQLIATTEKPKVMLGQCAYLQVKDVNQVGAFLDWGLSKDLFVPFKEQSQPMEVGKSYVVYVYLDSSGRLSASTRLSRFLSEDGSHYKPHQEVEFMVYGKTTMGYKVVIDREYVGLIFRDEAFKPLRFGQRMKGYIKSIREDGKIDLTLQQRGQRGREDLSERIVAYLRSQGGTSTLTDKSAPDNIYHIFNVSKAEYKKALGALYKSRRITIAPDLITLLDSSESDSK